jgi:hypothetical protein
MTAARKEQKHQYDEMKDIRVRMQTGQPTTFAERNRYYMYEKSMRKKKEQKKLVS